MTTKSPEPTTFSSGNANALRAIEREAVLAEVARFGERTPEIRAHSLERNTEAWAVTDGVTSRTHFVTGNSALQRLLQQVEHHMAGDFYRRLERWRRPRNTARDTGENDKAAGRVARWFARKAFPVAWRETLQFLDRSARAYQTLQAEVRATAVGFVETQSASLKPPPAPTELDDLARRLFEAALLSAESDEAAMADAAKTNPVLRAAMRAYDEWRESLNDLVQRNSQDRIGREQGSETDLEKELRQVAARQNALTYARTFAFHWPTVVHEWQATNAAALGVRRALAGPLKDEARSQTPEAAARLREAAATELAREEFVSGVGLPWPARHEEAEDDGMAAPLAKLFVQLRARFCPTGKGPALARLQELEREGRRQLAEWKAQERFEGIDPPVSPWQTLTPTLAASFVAQVVWFHRVGGELQRETASTTALVTTVHAGAEVIWSRAARQAELELLGPDGAGLAWVLDIGSEEDAAALFGVGNSLTFQRLMRYLPTAAHSNWRRTGHDEADVHIEGGYARLAELAGCKSKKAAEEVRQALILGSSIRRVWSDGSEAQGLWTFHTTAAAPGRKAQLTVTLAAILRPGFVHGLPVGPARTLVPVVPIPTLVGDHTTHGAQAAFQWTLTRRLAEGRREAAREGGVTITPADLKRDAERVGLPARLVPKVLEAWQAGEKAFLERIGGDRWAIADTQAYAPARAHLLEQAKMAATGAKRGLAAAARKRGMRNHSKQNKK